MEDEAVDMAWQPQLVDPDNAMIALPPRDVAVQILDAATGKPLPAVIRALGSEVLRPVVTDGTSPAHLSLSPGTWEFLAARPRSNGWALTNGWRHGTSSVLITAGESA